jgi:hypothetical protein
MYSLETGGIFLWVPLIIIAFTLYKLKAIFKKNKKSFSEFFEQFLCCLFSLIGFWIWGGILLGMFILGINYCIKFIFDYQIKSNYNLYIIISLLFLYSIRFIQNWIKDNINS